VSQKTHDSVILHLLRGGLAGAVNTGLPVVVGLERQVYGDFRRAMVDCIGTS
jgi:hypothetical protein